MKARGAGLGEYKAANAHVFSCVLVKLITERCLVLFGNVPIEPAVEQIACERGEDTFAQQACRQVGGHWIDLLLLLAVGGDKEIEALREDWTL